MGKDHSELVVSDSINNAIEKACKKCNEKEFSIFEITNLGDIIT